MLEQHTLDFWKPTLKKFISHDRESATISFYSGGKLKGVKLLLLVALRFVVILVWFGLQQQNTLHF